VETSHNFHNSLLKFKMRMNSEARREAFVFFLLLAFGVVGRWAQPDWNFTPLAAVTAMGAYYFRGWLPAILLPASMLAISDLLLLPHDNWVVPVSVHLMAIVPLALGRAARRAEGWRCALCWGLCGVLPATAFFIVTNFAVWASKSMYAATAAGLLDCYVRALPFYRTMLTGDICYVGLMAGCLAAAHIIDRGTVLAPVTERQPQ
jgi:hypothetical protein